MSQPSFEVQSVNLGCFLIHDRQRTVAIVTPQGFVDWLLRSPMEPGPRLTEVQKETHLCFVLGLKMELIPPSPGGKPTSITHAIEDEGRAVRLIAIGKSNDEKCQSITEAVLRADDDRARYRWDLTTKITNISTSPVDYKSVEFNNVYPTRTGRCFLFSPDKKFDTTLMTDRDGVVWKFPHQHMMHYSHKIDTLNFAPGTLGGFFGEPTGSPVVIIKNSSTAPDWAICDMFYDLHCMARLTQPLDPGQTLAFEYVVKYLSRAESDALVAKARPIPVSEADLAYHDYPRLELGSNGFISRVDIAGADDASGFRQRPPQKVWDRQVGATDKGSLRITNDKAEECVWSAEPPTQIPNSKKLNIRAKIRTRDLEGKGAFIRIRYHTFHWRPTPHVEWVQNLESAAVNGTTDGWVEVVVPELQVPLEHFDYLIWFDVVLDGKGEAWFTDVDISLQEFKLPDPGLEIGGSKGRKQAVISKAGAGAGAAD